MYEYEIIRKGTNNHEFIYGYSYSNALKRKGYNEEDYTVIHTEYID